jgi:hypothetical protein
MAPAKKPTKLSEAQFQQVFNEVRTDISDLQLHETILSGVVQNLEQDSRLGQTFPAFFSAFYAAMRTDLIIRLGRIYDPEGTGHESCTLARCLSTLRDNPQFFTDAAITARLNEGYRKANPNYLFSHRPDLQQIMTDIDKIAQSRKRLIPLRHKVYAHKDLETVLSGERDEFLSLLPRICGYFPYEEAIKILKDWPTRVGCGTSPSCILLHSNLYSTTCNRSRALFTNR